MCNEFWMFYLVEYWKAFLFFLPLNWGQLGNMGIKFGSNETTNEEWTILGHETLLKKDIHQMCQSYWTKQEKIVHNKMTLQKWWQHMTSVFNMDQKINKYSQLLALTFPVDWSCTPPSLCWFKLHPPNVLDFVTTSLAKHGQKNKNKNTAIYFWNLRHTHTLRPINTAVQ